jgi:hypothetical protein
MKLLLNEELQTLGRTYLTKEDFLYISDRHAIGVDRLKQALRGQCHLSGEIIDCMQRMILAHHQNHGNLIDKFYDHEQT